MATSRIEGTATLQNAEIRTHEVVPLQIVVLDVDLERDLRGHQIYAPDAPVDVHTVASRSARHHKESGRSASTGD